MLPPRINDITTDVDDPPELENGKRFPKSFKKIVERHYPDLKPLEIELDRKAVLQAALELAQRMRGWTVTQAEKEAGLIQGFAVTAVFRFTDDFAIRVREGEGGGTQVDMRSKSRVGVGDLGANAKRIRSFFKLLERELEKIKPDASD